MKKINKKAVELKKDKYTIQVKYSKEAIEKKLMKFITPSGDEFEISAEEMISILTNQVNSEMLQPTFVDVEKINVVEVYRQIEVFLNEDKKKGDKIRIDYVHPYPLEFAIIEEVYKIAKIKEDTKMIEITNELIEEHKKNILPENENFVEKFYKSIKSVDIKK